MSSPGPRRPSQRPPSPPTSPHGASSRSCCTMTRGSRRAPTPPTVPPALEADPSADTPLPRCLQTGSSTFAPRPLRPRRCLSARSSPPSLSRTSLRTWSRRCRGLRPLRHQSSRHASRPFQPPSATSRRRACAPNSRRLTRSRADRSSRGWRRACGESAPRPGAGESLDSAAAAPSFSSLSSARAHPRLAPSPTVCGTRSRRWVAGARLL